MYEIGSITLILQIVKVTQFITDKASIQIQVGVTSRFKSACQFFVNIFYVSN